MSANANDIAGMSFIPAQFKPLAMLLGIAAAVAAGVSVVLWSQEPTYRLLYGNLGSEDAAQITQALDASGIAYRLQDGGAISVPADRFHDAKLKLEGQGLPESDGGFAVMSKDPGFGVSQFMESARYQHALESELARTIANLRQIEAARVHLALPRQSAFIRDRRAPSASVFLQLKPGRPLQSEQVTAIGNLVASSIPELEVAQVTIVDQQGRLLSAPHDELVAGAQQLEIARGMEERYAQRVEELLAPLVGVGRVRAQVVADVELATREEAREQVRPDNQSAAQPATHEYATHRTLAYTRQPAGSLKRLTVAVLVDSERHQNAGGKVTAVALTPERIEKLTRLVKDAVGFDSARGDSVSVVNVAFKPEMLPVTIEPEAIALWERPLLRDIAKLIAALVVLLALVLTVLRPLVRGLLAPPRPTPALAPLTGYDGASAATPAPARQSGSILDPRPVIDYDGQIAQVRNLVAQDPSRVAQVVKGWVGNDE